MAGGVKEEVKTKMNYVTANGFCSDEKRKSNKSGNLAGGKGSKKWDYVKNGADWSVNYPDCASDHQSPINFVEPVSDYGQAYDVYDFALDKFIP